MKKSVNQSTTVIVINVLSILFILAAILAFLNAMSANSQVDQSNVERFELTYNANRFMNASDLLTAEVRAYAVTGAQAHYDSYMHEAEVAQNTTVSVENMKAIGITPDEQTMLEDMLALSDKLIPLEVAAMDKAAAGNLEQAIEDVYGAAYEQTIAQITELQQRFLTALDQRAEQRVNDLIAQAERMQLLTLIFFIAVVALQIANALTVLLRTIVPIKRLQKEMEEIAKGNLSAAFTMRADTSEIGRLTDALLRTKAELKKYIGDISDKLGHMADGDLNQTVDIEYIGEFAPIKTALTQIIASLNDTMSQIHSSSLQVSTGSRQIADGAQALAQGSTQQAAAVEQLSASISEIAGKTKENAEMADKAAALSESIRQNAEKGSAQMGQMTQAVKEINDASQAISKVIKTIDDIAFQTNILALNAAVEAARAGQHGKGFAVVAEEVRSLASKSAEAAKDTGVLIQNSMEKAGLGAKIAGETAESLKEIVSGINESSALVGDIAASSEEQSRGIAQINKGIDQVAQVVQQNSATAEQSAAASEQMSGQSALLEELIEQFKLKGTAVPRLGGGR